MLLIQNLKCDKLKTYYASILLLIISGVLNAQQRDLDFFIKQGIVHSPVLKDIDNQVNSNTVDSLLIKQAKNHR